MKKLIYIFVIAVSYLAGCDGVAFAQTPPNLTQLTTWTPYAQSGTNLIYNYGGVTYGFIADLRLRDSTNYYITPYYFAHHTSGTGITSFNSRTGAVIPLTGDYSAFYPLLNGSGATGTWGIGISGNAATATNGVVTTGSYANPSWITAIPYSILSGSVPIWNQNTTGNSATATKLQTARTINGVAFDGTSNITIATTSANPLILGNGISGSSYDGSAPITASLDTSVAVTKTYSARYPMKSTTVAGFSLRSNITLASLTPNYGLVGSAYNGSTAQGLRIDTSEAQTVDNFFPKGDTRWGRLISGTGYAKYSGTSVSFVTAIPNADLSHSSTTINGTTISLGSSGTITATVPNSILFNSSGSGDASGTTFDGSIGHVISYNTIGAASAASVPALPINITISVGTTIPYNYVYSAYKEPTLVYAIPGTTSTELTTNGCSGMIAKFNYSSSGLTTLVSIDIYGNDDGSGHFNENTYVKISP